MVYPILTNEEMTTESQRYNCFIRNGGNAIPKHTSPEAEGSNPTTGLTLIWARNPFGGNFNQWQVSQKEAGQIMADLWRDFWIHETGMGQQVAQLHDKYMMMMMMILTNYQMTMASDPIWLTLHQHCENLCSRITRFLIPNFPHVLNVVFLFWVIPQRLNFICRRFGTLRSIFIGSASYRLRRWNGVFRNVGI